MKIAHYIASCGICSRRDAEKIIEEGRVKLNGTTHTNVATRVQDSDRVELDGKLLALSTKQSRLWMYYKPIKVLTTHKADFDADTVFNLVQSRLGYVISVGRLDYMSEGLLLLTNSNDIAHNLMTGDYPRIYRVCLNKIVQRTDLAFLESPFILDDISYKPWKIRNIVNNWIEIELYEGKNREIRKVIEALDFTVLKLVRISYGPYSLPSNHKPNEITELQIDPNLLSS